MIADKYVDQVKECQEEEESKLGYFAWHAEAEKRMQAGEEQVLCTLCQRWKWQDELCKIAVVADEETE